ncbi:MAG: alpha/beta hydrolase [Chloroflexota bacterium]|nr:alpha/beta hydrolase [Chloroflexota bacterium]
MLKPTSESQHATRDQERRVARVIHYDISYSVDGAERGTDGALVLLHDIVGGAFAWRNVVPQLAGTNRAIYAIDMLGYGLSDHPWPADTSIWGHADYLAMLFDQLNLTNIVLVGHGLGGGVAQVLATRLSVARVAALVLIDTTCYLHSFAENWPLPNMKERQDPDAPKHVKAEDVAQEMRATLPNAVHNRDQFKNALDDYVAPWDSEVGKESLYQQIRLLHPSYSNAVASDLKTMGKPTLIVWGQNDQQVPLKYAQRLHRDIPQSRLVVIPDAAHLTLFDAPDAVAGAITEFVGSV